MNPALRDLIWFLAEDALNRVEACSTPDSSNLPENDEAETHESRSVRSILDRPSVRLVPR
jgi:hypothetical protein